VVKSLNLMRYEADLAFALVRQSRFT
jgi:hypothetical protein